MTARSGAAASSAILAFVAACGLAGCATASYVAAIHSSPEPVPAGARLPLRVGLLVAPETRDYQYLARIPLGQWRYPFGKDLSSVAQATFSRVFEKVVPVESADARGFDLIVEPRFDEAGTRVDMGLAETRVRVAMTFTAADAAGVKWSKDAAGEVVTDGRIEAMRDRHGQAVSKAVLAAAVAMREELASQAPRPSEEPAPAGDAWWAKPAGEK